MATETGIPFVSKALFDLTTGEASIIEDDESRAILSDAYTAAATPAERSVFESAAETITERSVRTGQRVDDTDVRNVESTIRAVVDELAARETTVRYTHTLFASLSPLQAALYSSITSKHINPLSDHVADGTVSRYLREGMDAAIDDDFDSAVTAFRNALDASTTTTENTTSEIMLAWANFHAGEYAAARDCLEGHIEGDENNWMADYVGICLEDTLPQRIREGYVVPEVYFRCLAERPADWTVTVSIGFGNEPIDWTPLKGSLEYCTIPRLSSDTSVRMCFEGSFPEAPSIRSYYLALGTIDKRTETVQSAHAVIESGPEGATTTERLSFRQ